MPHAFGASSSAADAIDALETLAAERLMKQLRGQLPNVPAATLAAAVAEAAPGRGSLLAIPGGAVEKVRRRRRLRSRIARGKYLSSVALIQQLNW
jgi:hypothetical protein